MQVSSSGASVTHRPGRGSEPFGPIGVPLVIRATRPRVRVTSLGHQPDRATRALPVPDRTDEQRPGHSDGIRPRDRVGTSLAMRLNLPRLRGRSRPRGTATIVDEQQYPPGRSGSRRRGRAGASSSIDADG